MTSLLTLSLALAACGEQKAAEIPQRPVPAVLVHKIAYDQSSAEQTYSATIQARVVSDQAFRVSGKVVKRLVSVGDHVRAGTVLAELDATDLKLQLTQAEAEVIAARQVLDQQSKEKSRTAKLTKQGWAAPAALEKQQAATDEAKARLDKAEQQVSLARNAIAYAVLVADGDGVVTEALVEPGQVVAAGQKAVSIARDGALEALVAIPETQVSEVKKGEAGLSLWSDPSHRYAAKLRELSPLADPATRTFAARFMIENADDAIRLGMSATLHISKNAGSTAEVPLTAILDQGKGPKVWSVNAATGAITLKPVKVQAMGKTSAAISDGVKDGEIIVALGVQKLDAGLKVRPIESLIR